MMTSTKLLPIHIDTATLNNLDVTEHFKNQT